MPDFVLRTMRDPFFSQTLLPIIAGLFSILAIVALCANAWAHDWYPPECCNGEEMGGDCRKVSLEDMQEADKGCWVYLPTGNKFCGAQVRPSQDRYFHVCIGNKPHDKGKSYCAFILQGT